jgi:hypothetical protein
MDPGTVGSLRGCWGTSMSGAVRKPYEAVTGGGAGGRKPYTVGPCSIEAHYMGLAAAPACIDDCLKVLELVKMACVDTAWLDDGTNVAYIIKERGRYAKALQLEILKKAAALGRGGSCQVFDCGVSVEVTVTEAPLTLPLTTYYWETELPLLHLARGLLEGMRSGGSLPGDSLEAAALLLQAGAELERALTCPVGFMRRLAAAG